MTDTPNISPTNSVGSLYRQGDVLLQRVASLPARCQERLGATLAHGEVTGHSHRFQPSDNVQLWEQGNRLFLEIKAASATLVHEEHRSLQLPQGIYHVWKQREYRPSAYVEVQD